MARKAAFVSSGFRSDSCIDSEKVTAWFGFPIGIEPWVGGRYSMGGFESGHAAKVIDLEPGSRVSVDWGGGPGITTWELADCSPTSVTVPDVRKHDPLNARERRRTTMNETETETGETR